MYAVVFQLWRRGEGSVVCHGESVRVGGVHLEVMVWYGVLGFRKSVDRKVWDGVAHRGV